jgi:uncharacterized membrane protein
MLLTIGVLVVSIIYYPGLPEQIPSHWNIHGKVDGYSGKFWGLFLMPLVLSGIVLLFRFLSWLSPKQFQVDRFRNTYEYIMFLIVALLSTIQGVIIWSALHHSADLTRFFPGLLFLFFALMGNVLGKVRRNFWIGVRTPWTLASERVWNDTHRFAARLFVLVGLSGFFIILLGLPIYIAFGFLFTAAVVTVLYSLVEYKRLEKQGQL